MKKLLFLVIYLLFVALLFGCSSDSSSSPAKDDGQQNSNSTSDGEVTEDDKYGGHVNIRIAAQPTALGYPPALTPPSSSIPPAQPALETLGRYNPDGTMGPLLATDWEQDPEAMTVKLTLREGVKFHDGTEFNAEAVKWNLEEAKNEGRPIGKELASAEALSSHEILLTFNTWSTGRVEDLLWQYPMASPTAYEEMGHDEMLFHPVGTGPFKFDSMQNDTYIRYVRNDDYWQEGLPYLDSLELKIIVDPNTSVNAFLGKEVDVLPEVAGDIVDQYVDSTDFEIVDPVSPVGLIGTGFVGDSGNPDSPFSDVRVRKAVSYAINNQEITESIYKGYQQPSNQYVLEDSWSYNPDLEKFDYNPEKAKELLEEAGYADGFETMITAQAPQRFLLQAIQGYLAEVGIDIEVNIVDRAKYNSLAMEEGWEGLIMYVYTTSNELTSSINPHFGKNSTIWGPHMEIPDEMLQKMEEFDLEVEQDKRLEIAYELQSIIMEEHHLWTPIMINTTPYFRYPYVHDDGFWTVRGMQWTPETIWTEKK